MKSLKKIFIIIVVLLVVFSGIVYIDYFLVKTKNAFPKIAIKEELNDETTVYKAILYKVWYCKNNKTLSIGNYSDKDAICPKKYTYKNGYYKNSMGIVISKHDLELLISQGIYTSEMIEDISTESDLKDKVYVALTYGKTKYKKVDKDKREDITLINGVELVVFPSFEQKGEEYSWTYDYDIINFNCMKTDKDKTKLFSKFENGECSEDYQKLQFDDRWCSLYKNSTLIYKDDIEKLCEREKEA